MVKLRGLRLAAGFKTQQQFADAVGLSQAFIHEVESGRKKPRLDNLVIMAKVLDCSIDELVGENE